MSYLHRERAADPWRLVASCAAAPTAWRADIATSWTTCRAAFGSSSTRPRRFDLRLALSQVELNVDARIRRRFASRIPPGTQPLTIEELRAGGPLADRE